MSFARVFKYGSYERRSTVVYIPDADYFLEVRRGCVTWTAAFRKAHPDVKQRTWATLAEWWSSITDNTIDTTCVAPSIAQHIRELLALAKGATAPDVRLRCINSLLSYMLTPAALEFLLSPLHSKLRGVVADKMRELLTTNPPPPLRMKAKILLRECTLAPVAPVLSVEEAAPAPAPVATPLEEIHALFAQVEDALYEEDNCPEFKHKLMQEFVAFCLRPDFAAVWRSSTFERIQMRATLATWLDFLPEGDSTLTVAAIKGFLEAYPV